jgi:4-hydroxy-3-polyprenylbenzoate decarboxylase
VRTPYVVGVSGASGTPYAQAVIRGLLDAGHEVDLIVSRAARLTLLDETGITWHDDEESLRAWGIGRGDVRHWGPQDLAAGPSSGSYGTRGMVVVPASTAACAGISQGLSKDLLQRAADVTLKERRPLVVVPRETPLTRGHLVSLLALHDAGAVVLPASPAFYAGPKDVQARVVLVAGRVLEPLSAEHDLYRRWTGELGAGRS